MCLCQFMDLCVFGITSIQYEKFSLWIFSRGYGMDDTPTPVAGAEHDWFWACWRLPAEQLLLLRRSGKEFETGVLLKSSAAGEIQTSPQSRKHIPFPSSPPFQIFCQFFTLSETKGKPSGEGAGSPNSRTTRQSVKG